MVLLRISRVILLVAAVAFPISASSQSIDEAIGSLAEKLGAQLGEEGTQRLAIHGFSDLNGFESALGDFISEELTTSLFGAGDFDIVERNEFERVIREHERYASDIFNSETIAELGEFLAIEALITGSVTQFDDSIRINARAIDVETARVFAAAAVTVSRDGMVNSLIGQRSRLDSTALTAVPGSVAQPAAVSFENSYFRVVPASVRLWEGQDGVSITVEITNITSSEYMIAKHDNNVPYATTKQGDTFRVRAEGLAQGGYYEYDYFNLQPGATITAVYKLSKANKDQIIGNIVSLRTGIQVRRIGASRSEEFTLNLDKILIR